ncbi:hypothetical protein J132_07998 [Termitomyces sp. J132]|nr:hypothetical protein J132_07998 [Termitomyces sp. J132]
MEVEGEEEFKAALITIEEDKEKDEGAEETRVQQQRTWSKTLLCQVGNNELKWLEDFNERVAGVEQQFQRELAVAKEELVVVRAWYAVAKRTLVMLVGYWHDCQAFLAWQEKNNVGEGDWKEKDLGEVPDDNADLNA